jgi:hypothetical protein
MAGAVVAAFFGVAWVGHISKERLHRVILVLLVGIGWLLIVEGCLPERLPAFLPADKLVRVGCGIVFGLAIGAVSSILGVAGGELLIPTFIFAFGADIKTAGTASLLISLPTVTVGIIRYALRGAYADRQALAETVLPMGLGSIAGAALGGALVGLVPLGVLKVGLGVLLNVSAIRVLRSHRAK